MTAYTLADILRLLCIVASAAVCVAVFVIKGRLHAAIDEPGTRQVPANFWRALMLAFALAAATFLISLAFPASDLAGSPPAIAAILLCALAALGMVLLFVVATWQIFGHAFQREDGDGHSDGDGGHNGELRHRRASAALGLERALPSRPRPETRH